MPWSGCKSPKRSVRPGRGAGKRREGVAQGSAERAWPAWMQAHARPDSLKEKAEGTAKRRFSAGSPGRQGGGD